MRSAWKPGAPSSLLALAALALSACGGAGGEEIREVSLAVPGWTMERAASVGGADAPPEATLYDVISVAEDPAGNIYALNQGDKRILVFDSTGAFQRSIGRRGKGPGEFLAPLAMVAAGSDGLYVLDPVNGRLNRFRRSDGTFIDAVAAGTGGLSLRRMELAGDGTLLVEAHAPTVLTGAAVSEPFVARLDTLSGAVTPVVKLDTVSRLQLKGEQGMRVMDVPFAPRPVWTVDDRGNVLLGTGQKYEVFRQAGERRELAVRGQGEPLPVTEADRQAFLERRKQRRNAGEIPFPDTKPFFNELRAGPGGDLWVQTPRVGGGRAWEIFDRSGRRLGELRLPAKSYLRGISRGSLYVVQLDEDDVETLVRYRLRRG